MHRKRRFAPCQEETEQDRGVREPGREKGGAAGAEAREADGGAEVADSAEDRAGTASARNAENECRTASALHVWTSAAQNAGPP